LVAHAPQFVLRRLAEVAVDQNGFVARLSEGDGQIGGDGALIFGIHRRADDNRRQRAFQTAEHQVGAQGAKRLCGCRAWLGEHDQVWFGHVISRRQASIAGMAARTGSSARSMSSRRRIRLLSRYSSAKTMTPPSTTPRIAPAAALINGRGRRMLSAGLSASAA